MTEDHVVAADDWVESIKSEAFMPLLPLLRRTFSTFSAPERRQIGEQLKRGTDTGLTRAAVDAGIDVERARKVLPLAAQILGLPHKDSET